MKRRVVTVLCFLVVGAVVNVLVAWGFAIHEFDYEEPKEATEHFPSEDGWPPGRMWDISVFEYRGKAEYHSKWQPDWECDVHRVDFYRTDSSDPADDCYLSPRDLLPNWSELDTPTPEYLDPRCIFASESQWLLVAGWPFRCFWGRSQYLAMPFG